MSASTTDFWSATAKLRVVPVVSLSSPDEAMPLADALHAGGLPVAEVTLRRPDALEGLRRMAGRGDIIVGAGTVRTRAQLLDAVEAGAQFVVSPCLTDELVEAARDLDLPFVPGVATATEIQRAADAGFDVVKFFPAEANGGLAALRALAEPFYDMRFVPTGGITAETSTAYLAHPSVVAVGGSWMIPRAQRDAGDWVAVTASVALAAR